MILDTSAVLAVMNAEPEAELYDRLICAAPLVAMSAANWVELFAVVDRHPDPALPGLCEQLLRAWGVAVLPVTAEQARLAREGGQRFGTGRFRLNYGDCFAYAAARDTGRPLLFKGSDFGRTDVRSAAA